MTDLIELYFTRENIYLPVLHRPTFERGVAERLHLMFVSYFIDPRSPSGVLTCVLTAIQASPGPSCWFARLPLGGALTLG